MATKKKNLLVDHPAWAERLSEEWDWEKNNEMGIKPDEITAGSGKKIAWRCEEGHEWEASIGNRIRVGCGCPYCSGRLPIKGKTDLATTNPDLAGEWHPTLNGSLAPKDVKAGTNRKAWWQGVRCGHEWEATITDRVNGCGCPYCAGKRILIGFNDLATTNSELAEEWSQEKNGDLTPQEVTAGSGKKVWWRGTACGHEWEATITDRVNGRGCPYCAGKRILIGFNDLASTNPELAEEWNWERNGDLTPQEVTAGSGKKVWWKGTACGHEWEATISSRVSGCSCPICMGQRVLTGFNDLVTTNPELAAEWDQERNEGLTPQEVTAGSGKKVVWKCENGHKWEASICSRVGLDTGCPYCSNQRVLAGFNDLASTNPELAEEWHPTKNGNLTPQNIVAGTRRTIWWLGKCGHEWTMPIISRTRNGCGCPYCAGKRILLGFNDLATLNPSLAKEWNWEKNGDLTPQEVTVGSGRKVWWRGSECGHEWKATVGSRASGSSCPKCSSSRGEKNAAVWAVSNGFVVTEQWKDPDCRDQRLLPFDLMLYSVAGTALMETALIEYDGEQHSNPNTYFNQKALLSGSGYGFDYIQRHDAIKTAFCMSTHRILIRIPHTVTGVDAIGEFISEKLRENGLGWTVRRNGEEVV